MLRELLGGTFSGFEFFGGVPQRISYDNSKVLVSKIIGAHERKLTDGFLQLQSHYLFREHFCRVARPNEKGVVDGVVKFTCLTFYSAFQTFLILGELASLGILCLLRS